MSEDKYREVFKVWIFDGKNEKIVSEACVFADDEKEAMMSAGIELAAAAEAAGIPYKEFKKDLSVNIQHIGRAKVPDEKKE